MDSRLPQPASLCYLVAETTERFLRIQRILSIENGAIPREYAHVVELFESLLNTCRDTLSDNGRLIRKVLFGGSVADHERVALLAILAAQIKLLYGIHERLVFLPRQPVEPEIFFTLQNLFNVEWNQDVSVILTTIHNAYEYRMLDVLRDIDIFEEKLPALRKVLPFDPESSILELHFVDRDNPLSWPFLAHEFGHSIDRRKKISSGVLDLAKERVQIAPESEEIISSWVAEVFADFVAGRVLGPAAILPLFSLELGLSPIIEPSRVSPTHPPTPFRLSVVRSFLSKEATSFAPFENFFRLYQTDQDLKFDRLGEKAKTSRELEDKVLKYLFTQIEGPLIAEVEKLPIFSFGSESQQTATQLKERLKKRIPVPSYRTASDSEIRSKLGRMSEINTDANSAYEVFGLLNEKPARAGEILSAGWQYKLETYSDELKSVFDQEPPNFQIYSDYLQSLDNLLLKSLQLSSVHDHLHSHLFSGGERN